MWHETLLSCPRLALLLILGILFNGCHLEQGKLYFDKLGLDPITVYKMAPLEKTIFCLVEADNRSVENYDYLHSHALRELQNNPQGDWSELVCLSLSDQAEPWQISQTVRVLGIVEDAQSQPSNPVTGFIDLMQDRLALYDKIAATQEKLVGSEQQLEETAQANEQDQTAYKMQIQEQNKKILQLEQQVRELKEIELLLHPKQ